MNVIVYHDDNDGRLAAAIMVRKLKQDSKKALSVIYVPAVYNKAQEIADNIGEGDDVYILDFSFSNEQFGQILGKAHYVTWVDHHKTSIERVSKATVDLMPGLRSTEQAACMLTWMYCFPKEESPMAVKLVADRDAWHWKYGEQTAEFHYGLSLHDTHPTAGVWQALLGSAGDTSVKTVKGEGRVVLQALGQRFKEIREAVSFRTRIDGHTARAMNIAIAGSAAFGAEDWATGALPDDVEICCQYYHNGEVFTVSMYSKKGGVDVSELCKKRGGGGHANAAGFTSVELPDFLRIG